MFLHNDDLGLLQTGGLREWSIEDLVQFFEGSVLSFDVEEVDENCLEGIPGDVEEVEPPLDCQTVKTGSTSDWRGETYHLRDQPG